MKAEFATLLTVTKVQRVIWNIYQGNKELVDHFFVLS